MSTDIASWLAAKGMRPLAATAAPVVVAPAPSPAVCLPATVRRSPQAAQRQQRRPCDVLPLSLSMPIPSTTVLAFVPVVVSPVAVREHGVWVALAAPSLRVEAVAVACAEAGVVTSGLWLRPSSPYVPPTDLGSLAHWTGTACPEPVARLLAAGAPVIASPLAVAQQVLNDLDWGWPARWLDVQTQLCTVNLDGDLDEVAAWLTGTADLSAWSSLRSFNGIVRPEQPLAGAMRQAVAMTRLALGVAARCGTSVGTPAEDAAWAVHQIINARGLPIDRDLIERVQALDLAPHAVAKFGEIAAYACPDGRVRGAYRFVAQHTGRWSASEPALHNLRKTPDRTAEVQALIELVQAGERPVGNVAELIGNLERPDFLAPLGETFVVGDQKQAEPRGVFYFAGLLPVLTLMDRIDLYLEPTLQQALFGDVVEVGHPDAKRRRTVLKIVVIACGFGMGAGKLRTYALESWGFDFSKAGVDPTRAVDVYRSVFHKVQELWRSLGSQSIEAVRSRQPISTPIGTFRWDGDDFCSQLRSGRVIRYPRAKIVDGTFGKVLEYWKGGPLRGKRVTAWGGILFQHAVTGTLRDVHASHLVALESLGLNPVGHTHDEAVCLVPAALGPAAVATMARVMCQAPAYLPGLRLRCEPYLSERLGVEGLRR